MKRTKAQRVLAAACGPALGVLLAVPVGGLLAGAAGADSSCYTGCSNTATTVITTSGGNTAGTTAAATHDGTTTASSGLAFTGADIEEMAVIGAAAIGVGTLLVVRSRRRTA